MTMRSSIPILLSVFAACTPRAISPPARTFVMDSPALETGHSDAQLDVAKIGTLWGPDLTNANGRLRRAISPTMIVEGEAGILHLNNEGRGGDRNAYTGRAGVIWRSEDQRTAAYAGLGGGTSRAAGQWAAADAGVMVTGRQKYVRPVFGADLGYSAPLDRSRTFQVQEPDGDITELRLPRNVIGKVQLGVEIGGPDASLLLGVAVIKFWRMETSVVSPTEEPEDDDAYVAAGIGVRFKID